MKMSESIKELAAALSKAQGEMKGALKDASNPFFKSKYADLASVVEAIRTPFATNGLSYVQTVEPSAEEEVRVETMLLHASGEWLSCGILALPVTKADAQGYGSALTYARRYSLSAAAGVAPEDDDGNAAAKAMPISSKAITADTWDTMPADEQKFLQGIADAVLGEYLDNGYFAEAVAYIDSKHLDPEEKTALWSRFSSQHRSAMKAATKAKKAA
jgi:hypothetical protein